ncbi:hypothetical protein [Sporosarcina obsidiansis]|uniref:hypothetical protein n=1 Tax=Sporosarcina obsidiansis TaxID=2660748 RepID=UPI00129B66E3|nr:hypothetical protein [Sporosarcina obsidiansis]
MPYSVKNIRKAASLQMYRFLESREPLDYLRVKRKEIFMSKNNYLVLRLGVLVILFISVMTWYYPFSPFSIQKSYTYKPGTILYNDKTYEELLNEFDETYKKELDQAFENHDEEIDLTVVRTEYILPIFKQDWLIGTDPVSINQNKLDNMLLDIKQSRDTLLSLIAEVDYTKEQRNYLLNSIQNLLRLEDSIRYLRDETYVSRKAVNNLIGTIRSDFRDSFRFYVDTFYESTR